MALMAALASAAFDLKAHDVDTIVKENGSQSNQKQCDEEERLDTSADVIVIEDASD